MESLCRLPRPRACILALSTLDSYVSLAILRAHVRFPFFWFLLLSLCLFSYMSIDPHSPLHYLYHMPYISSDLIAIVVPSRALCASPLSDAELEAKLLSEMRAKGTEMRLRACGAVPLSSLSDMLHCNRDISHLIGTPAEIPGAVLIDRDEWTPENGLLSSVFKYVRRHIQARHNEALQVHCLNMLALSLSLKFATFFSLSLQLLILPYTETLHCVYNVSHGVAPIAAANGHHYCTTRG